MLSNFVTSSMLSPKFFFAWLLLVSLIFLRLFSKVLFFRLRLKVKELYTWKSVSVLPLCKGYIILSYQVRFWTLFNARRDDALFYEHVIDWCYERTRAEPECASTVRSRARKTMRHRAVH